MRAIAYHHLNRAEEFRSALAEAKASYDKYCPDPGRGQRFDPVTNWLFARFLVREAEALLGQTGE
jgi:hypothetical protein